MAECKGRLAACEREKESARAEKARTEDALDALRKEVGALKDKLADGLVSARAERSLRDAELAASRSANEALKRENEETARRHSEASRSAEARLEASERRLRDSHVEAAAAAASVALLQAAIDKLQVQCLPTLPIRHNPGRAGLLSFAMRAPAVAYVRPPPLHFAPIIPILFLECIARGGRGCSPRSQPHFRAGPGSICLG